MQKYLDWATFLKLDNAMTIDFLSSLAATLHEQHQFPSRNLEQLQQTLSLHSSEWTQSDKSIVSALNESHDSALAALMLRYGVAGFSFNHTRFALRPLMAELLNRLAIWADLTLKKGELTFNRAFFVYREQGIEKRELFSQVLYAMTQQLHIAMTDIKSALSEISTMRPAAILDTNGDLERIDDNIAVQMGFAGLDEMGTLSTAEGRALGRLSLTLSDLAASINDIVSQLILNCQASSDLLETTAYCELLNAEVQKFSGMRFPESKSPVVWEMRRQAICFSVYTVSQLVFHLGQTTARSIAPSEVKEWRSLLSTDVANRLAYDLFSNGHDIKAARTAANSLITYCLRHDSPPSQLIAAELKKIHPLLSEQSLNLLLILTSQEMTATPGGAVSKNRIAAGTKKIRKSLSNLAPFAAPLAGFALIWILWSCGVKTKLVTDIDDLRPAIPYRTTVTPAAAASPADKAKLLQADPKASRHP